MKQNKKTGVITLFTVIVILILLAAVIFAQEIHFPPKEHKVQINFLIDNVNKIEMSSQSIALAVSKSVGGAGSNKLMPAYEKSVSWGVLTNETNKKMTVEIDSVMPPFTQLYIKAGAPEGAFSEGRILLKEKGVKDVVLGISHTSTVGLPIEYYLEANLEAGPISFFRRTLTFTLSDG